MAANVQKKANDRLQRDLTEAKQFKSKYNQLVEDLEGDFSDHDSAFESDNENKQDIEEEKKESTKRKPTVVVKALKNNNEKLKEEIVAL